ncbi:hypothetical protein TSA1_27900 [Bradyrhizobium nitroreducens]|uniref:Uncharacterized protein n=1 Tax=Bradyrhizobium nitroreducens TaxID=709803 RepID=A0A2M6UHR7_9BRAD|nr:hypothetical protein TSA1_27900 [Bradyrhizobium nitroreducens]
MRIRRYHEGHLQPLAGWQLESSNFARPTLGFCSRFRPHEDISAQRIHERRDDWAQIIEYKDRLSLAHEQHQVVLPGCSDDDLCEEESRAGPAGSQQQMPLGDGVIPAIALVRKYLPFRVASACRRILWRYAEIHR